MITQNYSTDFSQNSVKKWHTGHGRSR